MKVKIHIDNPNDLWFTPALEINMPYIPQINSQLFLTEENCDRLGELIKEDKVNFTDKIGCIEDYTFVKYVMYNEEEVITHIVLGKDYFDPTYE